MVSNTASGGLLKVKIPQGIKFIMITDNDNSENLKSGISVELK